MSQQATLKLSVMGSSDVGKTTIMQRFTENSTNVQTPTIGVEYFAHLHNYEGQYSSLNNQSIKFSIWDLGGGERFKTITRSYLPATQGIILVYDLNNYNSFCKLEEWLNTVRQYTRIEENIPGIVLANKRDLPDRKISKEEGQKWADEHGFLYAEVSAKNDQFQVHQAISEFLNVMVNKYQDQIPRERKKNSYYPRLLTNNNNRFRISFFKNYCCIL